MLAVAGVFLLASCALALVWAAAVFHQPQPPAWTRRGGPGAWVTLGIMLLAVCGAGALLEFGIELRNHAFSAVHALLCAGILVVAAVLIANRKRLFSLRHAPPAVMRPGPPANDPLPPARDPRRAA